MPERRLAKIRITFKLLSEWITEDNNFGFIKVIKGLPKDAVFIASFFDESTMINSLIFEHDSFSLVPIGDEIPEYEIEIKRYYPEEQSA